MDTPAVVIVKHNNPCGVAISDKLATAYHKALMADRVAAFGGAVAVNRPLDLETAKLIVETYCEVVVAPEFEEGVMDILNSKKNLRVFLIRNASRLASYANYRSLEMKSLIDGGVITQWSFVPQAQQTGDFLPAETEYKGQLYKVERQPTEQELADMLFGWKVEAGVTSNSVLYVKDGVTVGIGTGEQDRVGVAEIARDKAYRKLADKLCWGKIPDPIQFDGGWGPKIRHRSRSRQLAWGPPRFCDDFRCLLPLPGRHRRRPQGRSQSRPTARWFTQRLRGHPSL
jgi:phosphoribosylaminoimidazolecarboxamide formyltransferase/IMP cyclohydrolase